MNAVDELLVGGAQHSLLKSIGTDAALTAALARAHRTC